MPPPSAFGPVLLLLVCWGCLLNRSLFSEGRLTPPGQGLSVLSRRSPAPPSSQPRGAFLQSAFLSAGSCSCCAFSPEEVQADLHAPRGVGAKRASRGKRGVGALPRLTGLFNFGGSNQKSVFSRLTSRLGRVERRVASALKRALPKTGLGRGLKSLTPESLLSWGGAAAMVALTYLREGSVSAVSAAVEASPRGREVLEWSTRTAIQCAVGAASFWGVCVASASLQLLFRVHCASLWSRPIGLLTVAVASNASAASAAAAGFLFSDLKKLRNSGLSFGPSLKQLGEAHSGRWGSLLLLHFQPNRFADSSSRFAGKAAADGGCASSSFFSSLAGGACTSSDGAVKAGVQVVRAALRESLVGGLAFYVLGGKAFRLSPSSLLHPGAFASRAWSLPSLSAVAQERERHFLKRVGMLRGCHTCGRRRGVGRWIADHQPPTRQVLDEAHGTDSRSSLRFSEAAAARRPVVAASLGRRLLRSVFGVHVLKAQRLYPQCGDCSLRQAPIVRAGRNAHEDLVFEWRSVRLYHLAGGLVALWRALDAL